MKTGYRIPEAKQVKLLQIDVDGNPINLSVLEDYSGRIFAVDLELVSKDSRVVNPYTKKMVVCCIPDVKE